MYRSIMHSLAALCLSALVAPVHADASFEMSQSQGGVGSYQVSDGKVRVRASGPGGQNMVMIFDSREGTITQINEQQKIYAVMDQQAMRERQQQMQARMREMMPQMEQQMRQQLNSMPPQQRQMVEQRMAAMKRSLAGVEPERLNAVDTGRDDRVNGIECRVYQVQDKSQSVGEACVAGPDQLGISRADYDAVMKLFETMQQMSGAFAAQMPPKLPGIPVRQSGPDGAVASEMSSVSSGALDAGLFRAPAGFRQVDPNQGPPGGG